MSKKVTKSEELKCVWNMGTACEGDVVETELFDAQIKIPICESHTKEHRDIMVLHKNGYDIEEVLNMTSEERRKEVLTIELSGLAREEIKL
jgi:hypothetical protein